MAQVQTLVCDACGSDLAVQIVAVIIDDTAWSIDLCAVCRSPISEVLVHARESRLPARTRGSYGKVTLEHLVEVIKRERAQQ
jgi:hypothetical protein